MENIRVPRLWRAPEAEASVRDNFLVSHIKILEDTYCFG